MPSKAVFFDRDGTLNYDPGYLSDPAKVKLYPGVQEGIKILRNAGFSIVVISNQSGIARGYFNSEAVILVNSRINELLNEAGASVDKFYFCPFHPDYSSQEESKCRKPSPQMVLKAAEELNIDLSISYFVGDTHTDVLCGNNAGVKSVLVKNLKNDEEINILRNLEISANFVADNFLEGCNFILSDFCGGDVEK